MQDKVNNGQPVDEQVMSRIKEGLHQYQGTLELMEKVAAWRKRLESNGLMRKIKEEGC
ncbi:hypothetical protein [Paraflavitalea speifideaquila]|uniref:hypothetical protein n=1 Tax=Paraflavitalea speifideaquila TaxID=3076558 RepID=UPI0028EFB412|nr:hypothetical protein [Paraflavitalea speifideiaquila]